MTIIEASSVSVKTMADGTLRVSVDVEPRHAQAAFALFGAPGTPMALAALKTAKEAVPAPTPEPIKEAPSRPIGPICQWLVMRCKESDFRNWIANKVGYRYAMTEQECADAVKKLCGVSSRADIDGNKVAADLFQSLIRGPWLHSQQQTA